MTPPGRPLTTQSGLRTVAEVLTNHVPFQLEGIDRMYCHLYVPRLQTDKGVAHFGRFHRGHRFASSALLDPMTKDFVRRLERFAQDHAVPVVTFQKDQRQDDVAQRFFAASKVEEALIFIGMAPEKVRVFRTERRQSTNGGTYPWIVCSTAMVNRYYLDIRDRDFGPFFLKFSSYFPDNAKLCLNGHESLKAQLAKAGIPFQPLDNGLASCADPKLAQAIADSLSSEKIDDQRAAGLRYGQPRVQALLAAILGFALQVCGFTKRELRERLAPLLGLSLDELNPGRMTDDLRRLRLHGLIERIPKSHRDRLTHQGIQVAMFFTRSDAPVLRSGAAQIIPKDWKDATDLRRAIDRALQNIDSFIDEAKLVA